MHPSSAPALHYAADGLIACHACDGLHRLAPAPEGGKALCTRCGTPLYRNVPESLDRSAALYLAAFLLFLLANAFPLVGLKVGDRVESSLLVSGGLALYRAGMGELGLLILLTSFVFPLLTIGGMLYLLLPLRFGLRPAGLAPVWRMVRALTPWSLTAVFMLGLLVSMVKLQDLATIVPGIGFAAFVALLVTYAAAVASFDAAVIWPRVGPPAGALRGAGSAASHGYAACHSCELLIALPAAAPGEPLTHADCPRCGGAVHGTRLPDSVARTWALVVSATLLLVPANLYPVMTVVRFGQGEPSTILAGVVHMIEGGNWPLAMLVFFASFVVPISKIVVLVLLLLTVQRGSAWRVRDRTQLFRAVEAVGAWSMVDVFLVGILVALVQMDALASVQPGIGASFFGAAVVITMLAARSFDPRLVWDRAGRAP